MKNLKTFVLPISFVALLLGLDQLTKHLAVIYLKPIGTFHIIEGVLSLQYWENSGMAFGLFQGGRWFFVVFTIAVLAFIIYYYITLPNTRHRPAARFFLLMLIGGALGNFVDRLLQGHVVDFIFFSLINFPIFNLADVFLVVAVFAIAAITLFAKEPRNG